MRARVLVVGGGVIGASVLYHLARLGWRDLILAERAELTSGSTWHAAGLVRVMNPDLAMARILQESARLYQQLADDGEPIGWRPVGSLWLANTADRMDAFRHGAGVAKSVGAESVFLSPAEAKQKWPFADFSDLRGALFFPAEGYVQPADLTMALAALARKAGAEIFTRTPVSAITRRGGLWRVQTPKGEIACEHIVAATGAFARKTGAMVGLDVPAVTFAHQYLVTAPYPDLLARKKAGAPELPVLRDMDGSSSYLREENGGLLLGPYESHGAACYPDGVPDDVEYHLFDADMERIAPSIEAAMRRTPILRKAEIKRVYNGAICYTPDGNPLLGPAWGLPNFWLAEGVSFGFAAGGGLGKALAEWVDGGEPPTDLASMDARRFGDYANRGYAWAKAAEVHERFFAISYPDEERPAARPLLTSPCYGRMKKRGAIFGAIGGWERPNWFSPNGKDCAPSFRRGGWFDAVGAEVKNINEAAGIMDLSPLAKFRVSGDGARRFLDRVLAAKMPAVGRSCVAHLLSAGGGVLAEFMVFCEDEDSLFYLTSAAARRRMDLDVLQKAQNGGENGAIRIEDVTAASGVFLLAGPNARAVLERAAKAENIGGIAPMRGRRAEINLAPALVLRLAFTGEAGYEIHHPLACQNRIFDALLSAGEDLRLRPFGFYALDSMRLEKSHPVIGRELSAEFNALESGLEKFVDFAKGDFVGREALLKIREKPGGATLATLEVAAPGDADALGGNPVFADGKIIGRATSGNYGHRVGKSLALAMLRTDAVNIGDDVEIEILGVRKKARVIPPSPFDSGGEKSRA